MTKNKNLHCAKRAKNDEFYTMLPDIEKELGHYEEHFKDKVVFCNCDDPEHSNFYKYFFDNFVRLGLKGLITAHYRSPERKTYGEDYGDGDFRSRGSIELLKKADIVVTNPPFSLFREYIAQLVEYDKKFLIIGNMNAITYKEVFRLIKDNKAWLGAGSNKPMEFILPDSYERYTRLDDKGRKIGKGPAICWYTNLDHKKRNEKMDLVCEYKGNEEKYPKYDNYDAIEVSKTKEIPVDYDGVMGVPISFLTKYNPEQFEIIDVNPHFFSIVEQGLAKPKQLKLSGRKDPYARIFIKHKK